MTGYLLAGVVLGGLAVWFMRWNGRRRAARMDEQEVLQHRTEGIETFIAGLSAAPLDSESREQFYCRLARVAARSVGAVAASVWEPTSDFHLMARTVEGLFPSQTEPPGTLRSGQTGKAKHIENMFQPAPLAFGEGLVGRVAANKKGEFVTDAAGVSALAAPLLSGDRLLAVVAVAHPASGQPFTSKELFLLTTLAARVAPSFPVV